MENNTKLFLIGYKVCTHQLHSTAVYKFRPMRTHLLRNLYLGIYQIGIPLLSFL